MFRYDKDNNVLTISRIQKQKESYRYESSEMYESFCNYLNKGIKEDIRNSLIPALNARINPEMDIMFVKDVIVERDFEREYAGYEAYAVYLDWYMPFYTTKPERFKLFELPMMDEFGVLSREGKKYAMIAELIHLDDITYDNEKMKIVTEGNSFITLEKQPAKAVFKFNKKNISAYTVLHALAREEGVDSDVLFSSLLSKNLSSVYRDKDYYVIDRDLGVDDPTVAEFLNRLKQPNYSLRSVRERLNRALSLDRAIGYQLSEPMEIAGKKFEIGYIIDEPFIMLCKLNRVNELRVKDIPNMMGYLLGEDIRLRMVLAGTTMTDIIRKALEDYEMYGEKIPFDWRNCAHLPQTICVPEDGKAIIIWEGTRVDATLLESLYYNGYQQVLLKENDTTNKVVKVPFEITVVSNRHFTRHDLGLGGDRDEWVFVDLDGSICPAKDTLCSFDVAALLSLYDRVYYGRDLRCIASLDYGLRKKVKLAYESFHDAFVMASKEFIIRHTRKIKAIVDKRRYDMLISADEMEALFFKLSKIWWRKLYAELKVIQKIETMNPVAYYSSFRKINTIVSDKNAISNSQHSITMGHYGRICPYETPSGKTMGIVGNRAIGCKIENNILKTSYYRVKHHGEYHTIDFTKKVWMSVEEEEKFRIADITSLQFKDSGEITSTSRVLARVPSVDTLEKATVAHIDISAIDFVNTDPNQHDSLTATTIPFQGADDSARVVFGLSMCKQAKALVNPEVPIVMTSAFSSIPRQSPFYMIHAEDDGIILEASSGSILMKYDTLGTKHYDYKPSEFFGDSVVIRYLECEEGTRVNAGDVLVSSNFVKDGILATGVNMLVGFVPEGSNYEDGIFCSKRAAHKFTSYGSKSETWNHKITRDFCNIRPFNAFTYTKKGDTVCKVDLGNNIPLVEDRSKKVKGFLVNVEKRKDAYSSKFVTIEAKSISLDPLRQGDKLANRHGNKGVTPMITDNADMPQFANGEFLDLCKNPAGVASRMNIGQVLECNVGLCGYILQTRINADSFNGPTEEEVRLLLKLTYDLANSDDPESVLAKYDDIPSSFKEHCLKNIQYIHNWKGCFNADGTAWMYNPRTGKMFESPMLVGVNYEYKLYHEVEKKEHARAGFITEPYVTKMSAPPKGASNSGGQRFGHMEMSALAAYGAAGLIHELQNERGDNPVARNNFTVERLHTGTKYKLDESSGIRRSVEYFVNMLEAEGVTIDFGGALPNNTKMECARREVYKRSTLLTARDAYEDRAYEGSRIDIFSRVKGIK